MEEWVGDQLAIIEFEFLEQNQDFTRNNHILDIFEWIHEKEKENMFFKGYDIYPLLLHDQHIFYKKSGDKRIGIYVNLSRIRPKESKQLFIILANQNSLTDKTRWIASFINLFNEFLVHKHIQQYDVTIKNDEILNDSTEVLLAKCITIEIS